MHASTARSEIYGALDSLARRSVLPVNIFLSLSFLSFLRRSPIRSFTPIPGQDGHGSIYVSGAVWKGREALREEIAAYSVWDLKAEQDLTQPLSRSYSERWADREATTRRHDKEFLVLFV